MERVVGRILFAGVSVSVCCLAAGLLWQWASIGQPRFDYELPHTHIARFLLGELTAVVHGRVSPARLINLGILALLLTPYLRVVLSMVYFVAIERNYKYGIITGFVGTILTYSLFSR
jgi:uncharacterized membrane protein